MAFKNVGTFDLGQNASGPVRPFAMDAAGIASGQAFLTSELEKRDMMVRTPLTSFTYNRDLPIRVGGGWAEFASAMQVGYGITGGSGDGIMTAASANGIPMIQADFSKGLFKTHMIAAGTRVQWIDMQRGNMTGRNLDSLLRDGLRMTYDKHMDENAYVGFAAYGTTGLLNNPDALVTDAAATGSSSGTTFKSKTPDQILQDVNDAILTAWEQAEWDLDAVPNHILMPYEQYNYLATTRVSELAEKTILTFLLENNVAKQNGSDLFIGATAWCKGAAADGSDDRMVVYCNKERYIAMDELVPLTRAMTSPNTQYFCYDTAYAGNVSEVEVFYDQTIVYVDGI
ncbi:MAG TPA: DUF2184 domain-containing protein [Candidatus Cottocaccamicrobium excrementipullorum]|nr:DUF2184 domain-containing protein [Candidatus Cottocaccamicrobium excrementipullorum]